MKGWRPRTCCCRECGVSRMRQDRCRRQVLQLLLLLLLLLKLKLKLLLLLLLQSKW